MKTSGSGNAAKMAGGVTRKNVPQVGNKGNQMPIHGHGSTKGGGDNFKKTKNTTGFEPR